LGIIINQNRQIMTTQETITQAKKQLAIQDDAQIRSLIRNIEKYQARLAKRYAK